MKYPFLFLATILGCTLLTSCKTSYTEDDMYYPTRRMSDYQATSESIYPSPQAYNISNQRGSGFAPVQRRLSSDLETPYESGHNQVKSSFGSNAANSAASSTANTVVAPPKKPVNDMSTGS